MYTFKESEVCQFYFLPSACQKRVDSSKMSCYIPHKTASTSDGLIKFLNKWIKQTLDKANCAVFVRSCTDTILSMMFDYLVSGNHLLFFRGQREMQRWRIIKYMLLYSCLRLELCDSEASTSTFPWPPQFKCLIYFNQSATSKAIINIL